MTGVLDVLQNVCGLLEQKKIEYFLVGSVGAMYYGRPRHTLDIDLVVEIKSSQLQSFESLFPIEKFYCPPPEILRDEVSRQGQFNLIHHQSGIKIDIVLLKNTEFYASEFSRRRKIQIRPGLEIFIASPEDIIIKKLDYFREGESEKHLADIKEIVMANSLDKEYLKKWIDHFGLQTQWQKI